MDADLEQESGLLVSRLAESVGTRAVAATVYGEPVERGNVTVIPVASTAWGFGGGEGTAAARAPKVEPVDGKAKRPEGSGGGGGARVRPVGYILIRDNDAEFHPIGWPMVPMLAMVGLGILGGMIGSRLARK